MRGFSMALQLTNAGVIVNHIHATTKTDFEEHDGG
jgi:hypothetical protein